jgi:hypothetical protein
MSAEIMAQAALTTALETLELNGVSESAPPRARAPYAVLMPVLSANWGTKDRDGRELRIGVTLYDEGPDAARLRGLLDAAHTAAMAMPRDLADWRVASLVLVRSRVMPSGMDRWSGTLEYRMRLLAD